MKIRLFGSKMWRNERWLEIFAHYRRFSVILHSLWQATTATAHGLDTDQNTSEYKSYLLCIVYNSAHIHKKGEEQPAGIYQMFIYKTKYIHFKCSTPFSTVLLNLLTIHCAYERFFLVF